VQAIDVSLKDTSLSDAQTVAATGSHVVNRKTESRVREKGESIRRLIRLT
jgi:hypothetical protein